PSLNRLAGASPVSFSRGLVLTACAIYLIRHIGLPDTGSGCISASTLNTVLSNPGVITSSGVPCAITCPFAITTS
ncbi:hypothetical protein, partial [Pseudomonas aeruginosa]|uniref:hypothetical protein n=1 Tax=Pseudomonas aeruginosa TaxID=287 RepID=UPI0034D970A1